VSRTDFTIALMPGDGIGEEVMGEAVRVLRAAEACIGGFRLQMESLSVGAGEYLRSGHPLPETTLRRAMEHDAILLGAMGLPSVRWPDGTEMTPQIEIREKLDLYQGVRPIYLFDSALTPLKGLAAGSIDLIILRENIEGLFWTRTKPHARTAEYCEDVLHISRKGSERLFRAAFRLAEGRRRKVTLVDKANVLQSMAYFRQIFDEVAAEFPHVETECVYVDAMALYLVTRPTAYDVVVTENMFGDILSDLAAGIVGGMGFAPSADIGDRYAVFQPSHGTAPDIAGKDLANPIAMILSSALMLDWLATTATCRAAKLIREAVAKTVVNGEIRGTKATGEAVTRNLSLEFPASL
jgi:3-isopropylmalate dehydrogenase